MKRTLAVVVAVCAVSAAARTASALATIEAEFSDIGGGLIAWDVFLRDPGAPAGAAVDFKFEGAINQVPGSFGFPMLA